MQIVASLNRTEKTMTEKTMTEKTKVHESVMYVYAIPPIDFGWEYLQLASEFFLGYSGTQYDFTARMTLAMSGAHELGWEGDHGGFFVFMMPDDGYFDYGFAFKQSNNGTTFVASPRPLSQYIDSDSIRMTGHVSSDERHEAC